MEYAFSSFSAIYRRLLDNDLLSITPWEVLDEKRQAAAAERFRDVWPDWALTPFARFIENGSHACWDGEKVVVVDPWDLLFDQNRNPRRRVEAHFASMGDWLLHAINEFINYDGDAP